MLNEPETGYSEIIINHGVLILVDFAVHLIHENKKLAKYNFPVAAIVWNH